jgi:carbon storage regulator
MLVLSRKTGERIWIGDNISVTVVRITGGGVRIGIEAPAELPVIREELKLKIQDSEVPKPTKKQPAQSGSGDSKKDYPATIKFPAN